jgi:hypothetical protein
MNLPPEPQPPQRRYSVRQQPRLDAETCAKLGASATAFQKKRAQILRHVTQWGLTHMQRWTVDPSIPDRPHLVHLLVDHELYQQVQEASDSYGTSVSAWLRHAMRQVTIEDFPENWCAGATTMRSREASYSRLTFGLWLDAVTSQTLEAFTQTFRRSAAEVMCVLIMQATPEDSPQHGRLAVQERRPESPRRESEGSPQ